MRHANGLALALTVLVSLLSFSPSASGQELGQGRIIITPGDMVGAGLASARTAVRAPFALPEITETSESIAAFQNPFSAAIKQVLVDQLSELLAFFGNRMLIDAGFPPLFRFDFDILPDAAIVPDGVVDEDMTEPPDGSELTDPTDTTADPDATTDLDSTETLDGDSETTDTSVSRNDPRPRG